MSGPTIDRANSSGDIWTPKPFLTAVAHKFGPLYVDLAATAENTCAPYYLTQRDDALAPERRWHKYAGLCWLNPPFSDIEPWARKCAEERALGAEILLLVPGSVGANWFWDYVAYDAIVYSVGRMVFDNCYDRKTGKLVRTAYPKDLILCHYKPDTVLVPHSGFTPIWRWQWKNELSA